MHDVVGKKLGVPVYDLIGGKNRNWVPTFATGTGNSPEEMIDISKKIIAEGFNCFRFLALIIGQLLHHSLKPKQLLKK